MDLQLTRTAKNRYGIFGELRPKEESSNVIAYTLEHAYPEGSSFSSKIPEGVYECIRGNHKLSGMDHYFETFEVTHVPGHSGILFHTGNYNADSSGCILLGSFNLSNEMLKNSVISFIRFMNLMKGIDTFELTIK